MRAAPWASSTPRSMPTILKEFSVMSSVRKKDRSPYYTACFKNKQGVPHYRSTKTSNKKEALRIAQEWEDLWRKNATTQQAKVVLNDILELVGADQITVMTLNQLFDKWLSEKQPEVSVGTYDQYVSVIKNARQYLGAAAEKDITAVVREDIVEARNSIGKELSESAANKLLDHLRMVFKFAVDNELLDRSPMANVKHVVVPENLKGGRRGLTLGEVRKVLSIAPVLWYGLIVVGLYAGQRLGDVVRLTWGKLEKISEDGVDAYIITVRTQKTKRWVRVPAAPPLIKHLLSIRPKDPEPNQYVFPQAFALLDPKGRVQRLSNQFYDLLVKADFAPKRSKKNTNLGHGRRRKVNELSFHSLRHSATTLMKAAGVPQSVVMDIVGHESPAISRIYTHIDDQAKARAVRTIEDVTI